MIDLFNNASAWLTVPHLVADAVGPGTSCEGADVLKSGIYPILAQLKGLSYVFIIVAVLLAIIILPIVVFTKHRGRVVSVFGIAVLALILLGIGLPLLNAITPLKCA